MRSLSPFYRSLASLHGAGIGWPEAVESASRGVRGGERRFGPVRDAMARGRGVSDAFRGAVDPLDLALLRAAEASGNFERVLDEMADGHEARARRRGERRTALAYPVLVSHVAAVLLPVPDLLTGNVGAALGWAAVVLVPVWGALLLLRRFDRRVAPEEGGDPPAPPRSALFRTGVEEADAQAFEALAHLVDAGVPLDEGLDLAARAGWGGRAAVDLARARERVARREDLAGAWRTIPDEDAVRLVNAERAGELSKASREIASRLRFDAEMRRKRRGATLPVWFTLLIGGIVAWRVISFYMGYYARIPG